MIWLAFNLVSLFALVQGKFCPSFMPENATTTICANENARCTFIATRQKQTSCNVLCASINAACARSYFGSTATCDNAMTFFECDETAMNLRCECVENVTFIPKRRDGSPSACRAYVGDGRNTNGCNTTDGCYYEKNDSVWNATNLPQTLYRNEASCKLACAGESWCVGVEFGAESRGPRCELWRFSGNTDPPRVPSYAPSNVYWCSDKVVGAKCNGPIVVPEAFTLASEVECGLPLYNRRECLLDCAKGTFPKQGNYMVCVQGVLMFPNASQCQPLANTETEDLVRVTFSLGFDINSTCGGVMTMASGDDVRAIAFAFANNVKTILNMSVAPSYESAVATVEGMNATLLFSSAPSGYPRATDYVVQFLKQKEKDDRLTTFNISSINGICTIETDTIRLTISFTSLFAYLRGLADWMLYSVFGALLIFIMIFLLINRKSDHPFAMLGAVISIINLGARIVFIKFLWDVHEMLTAQKIDAYFFYWCFYTALVIGGVTLAFNLTSTLVLLRYHAAKNQDAFSAWWTKHCFGITVLMSLCALNPANFMIFCSSTFNLDLFKGPVSHSAQKQFQYAGIVTVLLGDVTPIVLNILTLFEVDENSQLQWDGGTNSIVLPLIISVASIFVGIIRRICFICVKPQELKKLEECELVYEPEPELVTATESPPPKVVPFLAPMKQMEEGWAGVSLNQHLISPAYYSSSPDQEQPLSKPQSSTVDGSHLIKPTNNHLSISPTFPSPPSPRSPVFAQTHSEDSNNGFEDDPHRASNSNFYELPTLAAQNSQLQLLESQHSSQHFAT